VKQIYARRQAELIDAVMCLMLNRSLPRGREEAIDLLDLERYVAQCNGMSPQQFYASEPMEEVRVKSDTLRSRNK
jgi:hypothetical protein